MGFMKNMMKAGLAEFTKEDSPPPANVNNPANPPTRWEKAVASLGGIVQSVARFDSDGVDVMCFPGRAGGFNDVYRNVKDANGLEGLVNATPPQGQCMLGKALEKMINEAFERGFDRRPTSILVLTAGRPNDHEHLRSLLADTAQKLAKPSDMSVTFVHVGNDVWAERYLASLVDGQNDLVDCVLDDDIKKSLDEMKRESMNGVAGGLLGAVAGAGLGIGGMYLANKMNAKKRTKGWNGNWRFLVEGDELAVLEVKDDLAGNLTISGWPEGMDYSGTYETSDDGGMSIVLVSSGSGERVLGVAEDEHAIAWDDGSRWEEVNPDGPDWKQLVAAGVGGAAAGGATGYLLDKKFFNKANRQVPSDYVIILDRSAEMKVKDTGVATNAGPPEGVGGAAAGAAAGAGAAAAGGEAAGGRVGAGDGGGATKFGFTNEQAKFEDVPWGMLPPEAKRAAEALGFNKESWNEKEWIDIEDCWWEDLEGGDKEAARTLGWDKKSWDEKYEDSSWGELPEHVQRAARKLGWTKDQWDDEEDGPGWESWEKEWADFSPEEKRCAHVLGYYEHTWG